MASGHRTFKAAMVEYRKLVVEDCNDRLTEKGKAILEKLQTLRRLELETSKQYHLAREREKRASRKQRNLINEQFAKLRSYGIKIQDI